MNLFYDIPQCQVDIGRVTIEVETCCQLIFFTKLQRPVKRQSGKKEFDMKAEMYYWIPPLWNKCANWYSSILAECLKEQTVNGSTANCWVTSADADFYKCNMHCWQKKCIAKCWLQGKIAQASFI